MTLRRREECEGKGEQAGGRVGNGERGLDLDIYPVAHRVPSYATGLQEKHKVYFPRCSR